MDNPEFKKAFQKFSPEESEKKNIQEAVKLAQIMSTFPQIVFYFRINAYFVLIPK